VSPALLKELDGKEGIEVCEGELTCFGEDGGLAAF